MSISISDWKSLLGIAVTLGGLLWGAQATFAQKSELETVAAIAYVGVEAELRNYQKELALLETKPNKTPYDLARIKYLQDEIKRLLDIKRKKL